MTAPEQQAAPEQADLRQRIATALRDAAYDCDGHCGLDETECMNQHPITVAVEHHGVATDVYGPITALAEVAAAVLQPELAALREQLAAAQAETARLSARLDDYGSPILGPVPVPPPDLGSIRMAEARNELERTGTTDKPWAAGRGLCPEKTGCPSGLLALFQLTKRGRLPVHSGEYGGPCDGSGKKPSVVLRYTATPPSV